MTQYKDEVPYIMTYKSQNLRPNLDQKVGGGDLYAGHKKKCFQLVEPVSLKYARTSTPGE